MAIIPSSGSSSGSFAPKPPASKQARKIVTPQTQSDDALENSLRPRSLEQYIGQSALKETLNIAIAAAKKRGEALDHLLFYGPPGLGKTSISLIIAGEMGTQIKLTSAPALERPRDIAGILTTLQTGDILFIDEIHRLNRVAEEILYPAMEDFGLDITIGKGQTARIKRIPLNRFTLIGATTKAGALTSPLRDRFGLLFRLNFYEPEELQLIILRTARILQTPIDEAGALEIAKRARGTPRIANRLLKRVRDYAQVKGHEQIDKQLAEDSLDRLQIDQSGLDPIDRQLLRVIIEHYGGGPVGLETLSAAISEDTVTIEDVYEPFLLQSGFISRTPRGRTATPLAYRHLGLKPPQQGNFPLFEGEEF